MTARSQVGSIFRSAKRHPSARSLRKNRRKLKRCIEQLEFRHLMASDFVYDRTGDLLGFNARLQYDAGSAQIQLVSASNSSNVLRSLAVADFSGKVDIRGSTVADSLIFDSSLGNLNVLGPVLFQGAAGKDTVRFEGPLNTRGSDLTVSSESITLGSGARLSTQKLDAQGLPIANSGAISLSGITIELQIGAQLLTHVGTSTTYVPGSITLSAKDAPTAGESIFGDLVSPILVADRKASITSTGAIIVGGNVTFEVTVATQTRWDDVGEYASEIASGMFDSLSSIADIAFSLLSPLSGQVKIQKATGNISLTDTQVTSSGAVNITAKSSADSSLTTVGVNSKVPINGSLAPFIVSIGYGETLAEANVVLEGNTKIAASGDVEVKSNISSDASVTSRGTANGALSNSDSVKYAVSLALANTKEVSTVRMGKDAEIFTSKGSVNVEALGESTSEVEAESLLFRDGTAGLAVGVSVDKATVTTGKNGG